MSKTGHCKIIVYDCFEELYGYFGRRDFSIVGK